MGISMESAEGIPNRQGMGLATYSVTVRCNVSYTRKSKARRDECVAKIGSLLPCEIHLLLKPGINLVDCAGPNNMNL